MFIQVTSKSGKSLLINTDAIAYVELDVPVRGYGEREFIKNGVKIYLSASEGEEGNRNLICHEFVGDTAQKLREGLPKLLEAPTFD